MSHRSLVVLPVRKSFSSSTCVWLSCCCFSYNGDGRVLPCFDQIKVDEFYIDSPQRGDPRLSDVESAGKPFVIQIKQS